MKNKTSADAVVKKALHNRGVRERDYRVLSLKIHPWVCGRCGREFNSQNIQELTVHHKDHNHSNNPPDGSNWEHLCIYCHEDEHSRFIDISDKSTREHPPSKVVTNKSLSNLSELLENRKYKKKTD